ncbi:glycosyl hydrolase [Sphingomonas sp. TREG-RG-20F-R18-01]|uniref:glycoside hydrolase family 26 protein n=1 Tax=Sphingomonas sp. TREG-RG-20F-R18-01 TaxID=2914982 RepID=UPI001F591910|nr:glycosyl hydrolase [Sphingomonas sp. TREG-RG-20F-R18-01]
MVRTAMIALAATALAAIPLAATPASANPHEFVYKGAGCDGKGRLPRYEGVIGHKLDGVSDFFSSESWAQMQSGAQWALGCWQGQPYRLAVGLPLIVKGGTLSAAAAGEHDAEFQKIGALLVAKGQPNAIIRLGWEFNGDWYPWSGNKDTVSFVGAFRHVVGVLRAVPGQRFRIVWNPSLGSGTAAPQALWPGDDVVDLIGIDFYNQSWRAQDTDPAVRWQGYLSANYGLDWVATFAAAHGKAIVVPEWGTGTRPDGHGWGDDPLFIHNMAAWMRTHRVAYQSYWDFTASDYDSTMSAGKFPQALAAYKTEFAR